MKIVLNLPFFFFFPLEWDSFPGGDAVKEKH